MMARAKKTAETTPVSKASVRDYSVLIRPVITEKTSLVGSQGNTVVFRVRTDATKEDIRGAVERIFSKQVASVKTINVMGKPKRTNRSFGRRAGYKKAYVTLKEGQTIDIVEGI